MGQKNRKFFHGLSKFWWSESMPESNAKQKPELNEKWRASVFDNNRSRDFRKIENWRRNLQNFQNPKSAIK